MDFRKSIKKEYREGSWTDILLVLAVYKPNLDCPSAFN